MKLLTQTKPLYNNIKFASNFSAVQSIDELKALVDSLYSSDKVIGFDIETGYLGADFPKRALNMYNPNQFISGFSITNSPRWARYVSLKHDFANNLDPNKAWEIVKPLLEDKVGVAHNLLFEATNLRQLDNKGDGPRIEIPISKWHDSALQAYVLSDVTPMRINGDIYDGGYVSRYVPPFHRTEEGYQDPNKVSFTVGLKSLTGFRYNYNQNDIHSLFNGGKDLTQKQKDAIRFNTLPIEPTVVHYACDDAYLCLQLHLDQMEAINKDPYLPAVYSLEMQVMEVLADMNEVGVYIDWDGLNKGYEEFQRFEHNLKVSVKEKFEQETGRDQSTLNFNSPKQISNLVYGSKEEGGLGMEVTVRTDTNAPSTNDAALTSIRKLSPAVDSLLRYRQCLKMGDWFKLWTSLENQNFDNRLHPNFNQTRIQSGRFASSNPNAQNVTKRWWFQSDSGSVSQIMSAGTPGVDYWTGNARDYITASPEYKILSFDYKSAEIQFLAALAQEHEIISAFRNGEDFHKWTASLVFGKPIQAVTKQERQAAKTISFASVYGSSIGSMAQQLGITKAEMEKIYNAYFARFPKLAKFFDDQHELVEKTNEVRTWLGRRAVIWESMHPDRKVTSKASRMAVNIPVQGGATGDYTKMAMVRASNRLKKEGLWMGKVRLLMNQHDSLVFEVHDSLDMDEIIEMLTPEVQFDLTGIKDVYCNFDSFPPMSVDWEVGLTWGSVCDYDKAYQLHAKELLVEISEGCPQSVFQSVQDVLTTNPGKVPVIVKMGETEIVSKFNVKAHPDVISKILNGDPDIGIPPHKSDFLRAEFRF